MSLLVVVVIYVCMEDEMFDEILDFLVDELEKNEDVWEFLEVINVDVVWLLRFEKGWVEVGELFRGEGFYFIDIR